MRTHARSFRLIAALLTLGLPSLALANGSSRVSAMDGYSLNNADHPFAAGRIYAGPESFGAALLISREGLIQEELPPPWRTDDPAPERLAGPPAMRPTGLKGIIHELGAELVINADPFNAVAVDKGTSFSRDVGYEDIFLTASGFSLTYRLHFQRPLGIRKLLGWGPYVRVKSILFDGDSHQEKSGNEITADDMRITTITVGAHGNLSFGRFFLAIQIGIGLAFISEVDAIYYDDFNSVTTSGKLYDFTTGFGVDSEFRLGMRWRLGRRFGLSSFLAFGFGISTAPDEGDLFGSDTDPEAIPWSSFGIGLALDFGGEPAVRPPSAPPYREDERAAAPPEVYRR
ncbi:MAG: hypothetical protein O7H41_02000 [Planctomycetota bacterium]|nr:hypothetical protein [Planctomycetota bacterium]